MHHLQEAARNLIMLKKAKLAPWFGSCDVKKRGRGGGGGKGEGEGGKGKGAASGLFAGFCLPFGG